MTRGPFLHRCLVAALAIAAVLPAAARADDPSSGGAQAPQPVRPAPAAKIVSVKGPVAVTARADTLLGHVANFRGVTSRSAAGRRVVIQRFDATSTRWRAVARATVGPRGGFVARWHTDDIGQFRVRAVLRPRIATQASRHRATTASAELGVTIYKPAFATWYGPGFFGKQTACGQTLTPDLIGVAHRRLPCGTQVAIFYGGRTLIVPVVDRGPYSNNADWDLTQATAEALGMSASDTVGAVALR